MNKSLLLYDAGIELSFLILGLSLFCTFLAFILSILYLARALNKKATPGLRNWALVLSLIAVYPYIMIVANGGEHVNELILFFSPLLLPIVLWLFGFRANRR